MSKHSNKRLFILTFIALFFIILSSYLINNKNVKFGANSKAATASKEAILLDCLTKCIKNTQKDNTQFMKDVASAKCNLMCQRDISNTEVTNPVSINITTPTKFPSRPVPTIPPQKKPYFSFEKTSFTTVLNKELKVNTLINTFKGVPITSADIVIKYDPNMLELIEAGDMNALFDDSTWKKEGQFIYISRLSFTPGKTVDVAGKNIIASLRFRAKKAGSTILTFNCVQGNTADSNIILNSMNSDDIIDCSKNNRTTVKITAK